MRRGVAIAIVLMISALLLVCAFGIAAMGTMPLNLARANLSSVQQDLTAQAALEQVRYELLVAEEQQRVRTGTGRGAIDLSMPASLGIDLRQRFDTQPVLMPAGQSTGTQVTITFDPTKRYYSVDNSLSDQPAPGWEGAQAVAPFTVDFMINVTGAASANHYEAMLSRVWNEAVFCTHGLHIAGGSNITGNIGTNGDTSSTSPKIVLGDESGRPAQLTGDADVFFTLPADVGQIQRNAWVVTEGSPLFDGTEQHLANAGESALTANGIAIALPDPTEPLFTHLPTVPDTEDGTGIRNFADVTGTTLYGQTPSPSGTPAPLGDAPLTDADMVPVSGPPPLADNPSIRCLSQDLVLPDAIGQGTEFCIDNSITNYLPNSGPPTGWTYTDAGLQLKNCVLFVNGNLDLTKGPNGDPTKPTLIGDNATLIVGGTLRITQGLLNSGDHGFVILARSISLEAGGSYQGLVVAQKMLRIQPRSFSDTLTVRGGLLADGSDVTKSVDSDGQIVYHATPVLQALLVTATNVVYDPRYTKGLMGLGPLTVRCWRQAP